MKKPKLNDGVRSKAYFEGFDDGYNEARKNGALPTIRQRFVMAAMNGAVTNGSTANIDTLEKLSRWAEQLLKLADTCMKAEKETGKKL